MRKLKLGQQIVKNGIFSKPIHVYLMTYQDFNVILFKFLAYICCFEINQKNYKYSAAENRAQCKVKKRCLLSMLYCLAVFTILCMCVLLISMCTFYFSAFEQPLAMRENLYLFVLIKFSAGYVKNNLFQVVSEFPVVP